MRQHRTYSIPQTHTHTPTQDSLRETPTRLTTQRTLRVPTLVQRLALGTSVVVMLALLSIWLFPATQALIRVATSANSSLGQTLSPSELEDMGIAPGLLDDIFAHL